MINSTSDPSSNETFITLISAAKEDSEFANKLLGITRLSDLERKTHILQLVEDCREQKAPAEFIQALLLLGDDTIARKVSASLQSSDSEIS